MQMNMDFDYGNVRFTVSVEDEADMDTAVQLIKKACKELIGSEPNPAKK